MRRFRKLEVQCAPDGEPRTLILSDVRLEVAQILDYWRDTGCWWEGESEKAFYRLYFQEGRVYEIYQDQESRHWFLYKVYD